MDPDYNLAEQLRKATRLLKDYDNEKPVDEHDAARLAELVLGLDEWISGGGFLPRDWQP